MSDQRARPAVASDHRSAHPDIVGIPWWGAILTAVIASLIGFAFDAGSGNGTLTAVFATLYVLGCLIAVLAVQQSGVFTAVIQPPLVLFVTVPAAYFLMNSSDIHGVKDVLINCGYPLIQRFPLMFFTSAAVLMIGLARWYFAKNVPAEKPERSGSGSAPKPGALAAKLTALLGGVTAGAGAARTKKRQPSGRRRTAPRTAADRTGRAARPARKSAARPRHSRAPETEIIEPVADRPRRRRPRPEDPSASEPRRRPRPSSTREPREPREPRSRRDPLPPRERRSSYERDDRDDRYGRPQRPQRDRPQRRSRFDDYEPLDPYTPAGPGTHHPVSRVRYRGGAHPDDIDDQPEYRPRRRSPRDVDADRWEYDI
ncbi:folate/biopterin family MFS transporter [Mycobacterium sp. SMC-8]|uniref:folate/biopterin family MFS transporter n=1 Tax=Mycobacterium sp. SMC-8 TaxID=2857060 RepID=UPI0021B1FB71|nr:folate/biopterin family MFS transporter [Mycobacterium sp. SMC-8]UXA12277.1 folate/biopterin family MFS transporter [Mycobacterium sp. SMC-8]